MEEGSAFAARGLHHQAIRSLLEHAAALAQDGDAAGLVQLAQCCAEPGGPLQYGLKSTKPPLTSPPWFGTVPSGTKPGYHTLSSGVTEIIPRQNSKRQDVFTVGIYFVQLLALFH